MKSFAADISSQTKKALIPYFGREHVSVKHGKGTAWSWIHAHIRIPRPYDCRCDEMRKNGSITGFNYCPACDESSKAAHRVITAAVRGVSFSKYYDDCYPDQYDKFSPSVRFDSDEY